MTRKKQAESVIFIELVRKRLGTSKHRCPVHGWEDCGKCGSADRTRFESIWVRYHVCSFIPPTFIEFETTRLSEDDERFLMKEKVA